jgi:hypothetical protein
MVFLSFEYIETGEYLLVEDVAGDFAIAANRCFYGTSLSQLQAGLQPCRTYNTFFYRSYFNIPFTPSDLSCTLRL